MAAPEGMLISLPIRRRRRPETLPTKTTATTTGGEDIIMKAKKKRSGPFLCFGPPATDEIEEYYDEKERPGKDLPDVYRSRKKKKRLMAKIVRSFSMKSNSSRAKLTKDPSRLTSRKVSDVARNFAINERPEAVDSSENPLASESLGKNSDAQMFSSSSTSLSSSSSFSSSSSSSSRSSLSSPMAAAVLPKLQKKKTLLPPPGPRNNGYATRLTLVLLSLFVMVFCGRLTAILWTATWLCLMPRRRTAARRPPEFAAAERGRKGDCCGQEEKKRVVLEGFLQRNRKDIGKKEKEKEKE